MPWRPTSLAKQTLTDPRRRWHRLFGLILTEHLRDSPFTVEPDTSTLVNQLFGEYRREGIKVPYTMQDFRREVALEYLEELKPAERMSGLSEKEIKAYLAKLDKNQRGTPPKKPKRRRN
jgi:hypothetical protein